MFDYDTLCRLCSAYLSADEVRRLRYGPAADLPRLLRPGNEKLTSRILTFGLPAVVTCPGRSWLCGGDDGLCYATHFHYKQRNVAEVRYRNLAVTARPDLPGLLIRDVMAATQRVVRPHDSGDLYDAEYAAKWLAVMRALPDRRFFLFTRSWRLDAVLPVLAEMAGLKNVRPWFSVDRETGWPGRTPKRVRLAYMQADAEDLPTQPVDLVFRDYPVRRRPARRVAGALVCPHENGLSHRPEVGRPYNCLQCGLCWDDLSGRRDPRRYRRDELFAAPTRRRPLPLLT